MRQYTRRGLDGVRRIFNTLYKVSDTGYSTPCWVWNGKPRSTGYGAIGYDGKGHREFAHRVSWMLHYGPIPPSAMVLHKCDVRSCVRPDHLFLGSGRDNAMDKEAKGRGNHPRGSLTHNAVITECDALAMRTKYATGKVTMLELSREYGMSHSGMEAVLTGRTWAHVGGPLSTQSPHTRKGMLTPEKVIEIRQLKRSHPEINQTAIAKRFDVVPSHICRILSGESRRSV
jgi:HNH endonuclease